MMFSYMAVAKSCFSMMICRTVSTVQDGQRVTASLSVLDLGVECEGAGFWFARGLAFLIFMSFTVGFPVILVSQSGILKREETRIRPPKFDSFCRVSNIFDGTHRYWMAMMMARRAILVLVYISTQSFGGMLFLGSGQSLDFRFLPFMILVIYVGLQAHAKPFILPSDNALEQCILMALLLVIYADMQMDVVLGYSWSGSLRVRTAVVLATVLFMLALVFFHKAANQKAAKLAKVGIVTTKKVFVTHGDDDDSANEYTAKARDKEQAEKDRIQKENKDVREKYKLKAQRVNEYRDAFNIFDDDSSGAVDKKETAHIFKLMGDPMTPAQIAEYIDQFDDDNSGELQFPEMVGMLTRREKEKRADEEIAEAFCHLTGKLDTLLTVEILTDALLWLPLKEFGGRQMTILDSVGLEIDVLDEVLDIDLNPLHLELSFGQHQDTPEMKNVRETVAKMMTYATSVLKQENTAVSSGQSYFQSTESISPREGISNVEGPVSESGIKTALSFAEFRIVMLSVAHEGKTHTSEQDKRVEQVVDT